MLIYVIENLLDENSLIYSYSEHELYTLRNLYNERPSLPYRTHPIAGVSSGVGTPGTPEWICVDLGTYSGVIHDITYVGLFNHNLTQLAVAGDLLTLKGCDEGCPGVSGAECDWTHSGLCFTDIREMDCLGDKPIADFKNTCHKVNCPPGHQNWLLEIVDQANPDGFLEIGEYVLGQWHEFHRGSITGHRNWVRLSPGRADGPIFYTGRQVTHYGQDWTNYYSDAEHFTLTFTNLNDPCIVDELHAFLQDVIHASGKFILIPDDTKPFCYYVIVVNMKDFANRLIYGTQELREWRIELKTLTQGIRLL